MASATSISCFMLSKVRLSLLTSHYVGAKSKFFNRYSACQTTTCTRLCTKVIISVGVAIAVKHASLYFYSDLMHACRG